MSIKKITIIKSRNFGLFSNFLHTLQYLYLSEVEDRIPIVDWDIVWYSQEKGYNGSKNVWEYYFEPVSPFSLKDIDRDKDDVKEVKKYIKGRKLHSEPDGCWDYISSPPEICLSNPSPEARAFMHSLIKKYVAIKSPIQSKIDSFYEKNMKNNQVIGAHVRACRDNRGGHRDIPLGKYTKNIDKYLSNNPSAKVLITTDYKPFVDHFAKKYRDRIIYYNSQRSVNGFSPTCGFKRNLTRNKGGPKVGEEVLIECILLSKCDRVLHSSSNVSSACMYFNPNFSHKYFEHE
jgi:hypothetical protein